MNEVVSAAIRSLKLGNLQTCENMGVFPIVRDGDGGPDYLTMAQAMEKRLITVTEVDSHGSVPNLLVTSTSDRPVLILDGEELRGAKQNRVLNTSILIPPQGKVVVPVSCTEHGRWSYVSPEFADSGVVMFARGRMAKQKRVSESLQMACAFTGDQGEVWHHIAALHEELGTRSDTGAMEQAFRDRHEQMEKYLKAFVCQEGQTGLLAIIDGKIVGFDVLSRSEAYGRLHDRLVRSYAIDALARRRQRERQADTDACDPVLQARAFLEAALQCTEEMHASLGLGDDCRYIHETMTGAALQYQETVIHMAFFQQDGQTQDQDILHWGHRHRGMA